MTRASDTNPDVEADDLTGPEAPVDEPGRARR